MDDFSRATPKVWRCVLGFGNPGSARRAIYRHDAPAVADPGAVEPVDAGDRAILDREGERGFGIEAERQRQSGADRAAMRNSDDVVPRIALDQLVDRSRDPLDHRDKALAARRGFMGRGVPKTMKIAGAGFLQFLIGEALPLAEILFGEVGDRDGAGSGDRLGSGQAGANDCRRRLMGAAQMARHPHRTPRQLLRKTRKQRGIGAVAGQIRLAIDASALCDWRVAHPPEARRGLRALRRRLTVALRDEAEEAASAIGASRTPLHLADAAS